MTLPLLYLQPTADDFAPASRLLLHWRAADATLSPLTQQAANLSRNTGAWAHDWSGAIRKCMFGQPRFTQYDSTGNGVGDKTGLLLEPSRTNLWIRSATQTNAAYTPEAATVAAETLTFGPDGRLSAFRITENTAAGVAHGLARAPAAMADNTSQAISMYVQAGTRTWCYIQTINKANVISNSWVNLATGAVGTVSGNHALRIEKSVDGWWRIVCVFGSGSGATTPACSLRLATANNTQTYTGDGASFIRTFGWQHEVGTYGTSYIDTVAATVTRASDALSVTANWGVPDNLTVYFKLRRPHHLDVVGALGYTPYLFSHGAVNSKISAYFDASARNLVALITDAAGTTQTATRALSQWTAREVDGIVQYQSLRTAPTCRIDLNGTFGTASTPVTGLTAFGTTTFAIGDNAGGLGTAVLGGEIAVIKVIAGAVTLAEARERY